MHGTCEYVTLHNKRDSAEVPYVKDLEKGRSSWIIQADPWNYTQTLKLEETEREVRMMLYEEDSTHFC